MFLHVWSCFVRYVYFYHKSSYFFPFSFLFQFQILISRIMRQVGMADQSGTGQTENSDQIPDVSATQKNLCHQATMEFVAYIHNISPLKKGSYFDCQLQGKEKTVRGVCFSPPKLKRFTSLSEANSPVKIKKFRIDTKSNAEDLLMGHDVTIEHFPAVDFDKVKQPVHHQICVSWPNSYSNCQSYPFVSFKNSQFQKPTTPTCHYCWSIRNHVNDIMG